jgi:formylglycine-generating enzyme required for sulfatase activity
LVVVLSTISCSGNNGGSGGGGTGGGTDAGPGPDASTACTTDSQCSATVPPTSPTGCATGRCNAVEGVCEYVAKDEDGDGHAAANCKSNSGRSIQDGDDCNDHDPNLYPGHPEACTESAEGGIPAGTLCKSGLTSCEANGTQSPCLNASYCVNKVCVNQACVDCAPGTMQCLSNQPQTCDITGNWQSSGPACTGDCLSGACVACAPGSQSCSAGQPQTCDNAGAWQSGAPCSTGEVCNGSGCEAGCYIGGSFETPGQTNVANACLSCQPGASTSAWSNLADGTSCGLGLVCKSGQCGSQCDINGTVYQSGTVNPGNACETCAPASSNTQWSNVTDGTACGSGVVCHGGNCVTGCEIGGVFSSAGALDPNNPCQSCQPGTNTTGWSSVADGTGCGNGQVCSAGKCGTQCFIGSTVYTSGQVDPANACLSCQPGTSTTSWTPLADGTVCASGEVCSSGGCVADCYIGTTLYGAGAIDAANACLSCQPATSTSAWSNRTDGTSCAVGEVCSAGNCQSGCLIGATVYGPGALNPGNECLSCQPTTSTTVWSNVMDGNSCGGGEVCNAGSCGAGCYVGNATYGPGALEPGNNCQSCQPGTSTTAWTSVADGNGCGAGEVCSVGVCGAGCFLGMTIYTPGALNPANACLSCQPSASTTAWSNVATGTGCAMGEVCNAGTCGAGCFVGMTLYSANQKNPTDACQICQPTTSTTIWGSLADGTSCATGEVCKNANCQSGCFINSTVYAANALEPGNACQSCQPATSTTGWSNVADGTGCGGTEICSAGNCVFAAPNCAPGGAGLSNCGSGTTSCCKSQEVTGGTYDRAYSNSGSGPTGGSAPASISGFQLDAYEVTMGRFRQFVIAWNGGTGWTPSSGSGKHAHLNGGSGLVNVAAPADAGIVYESGWNTANNANIDPTNTTLVCTGNGATGVWTASPGTTENLPIDCVNWYEAYAFCIWDGGFLPSEAEWEYAAAGGSLELEYPWGSATPTSQYATYGTTHAAAVGTASLGIGNFGQYDMTGNADEWVLDSYASYVSPCTDCSYLNPTLTRETRDTPYWLGSVGPVTARTPGLTPTSRGPGLGFRCARTP